MWAKPNTDMEDAMREKLRTDSELPMKMEESKDNDEPTRVTP
jgi:hypothetical protein